MLKRLLIALAALLALAPSALAAPEIHAHRGGTSARTGPRGLRVPLQHGTHAQAMGAPLVTIRFKGKTVLLPRLDGPERARLKPPKFQP